MSLNFCFFVGGGGGGWGHFFIPLPRWNHEGCFDVLVVGHGGKSTKPILIDGDTLSIQGKEPIKRSNARVCCICTCTCTCTRRDTKRLTTILQMSFTCLILLNNFVSVLQQYTIQYTSYRIAVSIVSIVSIASIVSVSHLFVTIIGIPVRGPYVPSNSSSSNTLESHFPVLFEHLFLDFERRGWPLCVSCPDYLLKLRIVCIILSFHHSVIPSPQATVPAVSIYCFFCLKCTYTLCFHREDGGGGWNYESSVFVWKSVCNPLVSLVTPPFLFFISRLFGRQSSPTPPRRLRRLLRRTTATGPGRAVFDCRTVLMCRLS